MFVNGEWPVVAMFVNGEWPVAAMFVNGAELNEQSLKRTLQGCFLPNFNSFGQAVSEEKIF